MEWLMSLWHKRHSVSEPIKEYDRLVDGLAARKRLEKERPSLVAARDQAIVELRMEKLQKETAERPHKVARVRRWMTAVSVQAVPTPPALQI